MKDSTPMKRQYLRVKEQYPEAIILFRLGDFYEAFEEDAKTISKELEIVLTSRPMGKNQRLPMAGIPHHQLESYLARLINKGYKVAICEQLSDPKTSKGLVDRDVVRVVTPGTVVEPNLLESTSNNFLAALVVRGNQAGIAYVDITTSEFATTQLAADRAFSEIERLSPSEVLIPRESELPQTPPNATRLENSWFETETARRLLMDHFEVASLEGYGCADLPLAIQAAGAIIHYLGETQKGMLNQLSNLSTYSTESFMIVDAQTRRNLELFQSSALTTGSGSLLSVIDLTRTPMGGRLLKRWLGQPILDLEELSRRQEAVAWFADNTARRTECTNALKNLADIERLINRVRSGLAMPRELGQLRHSLEAVPRIKRVIEEESSPLYWLSSELKPCEEVVGLISRAIADEVWGGVGEGEVIKPGFSPELDELRSISKNAKQYLADVERKERERTGIKSLKVGYNKVFGYYIEVTSPHLDRVPDDYIRKQTLTGAERYVTSELKEYESLILNAQERIGELEMSLFKHICRQVAGWAESILGTANAIANIDVLSAFAEAAVRYGYVRPKLSEENILSIKNGRHPVVEQKVRGFVPNDTYLSGDDTQLIILTGPNMAGKSTYLRQVALIVLMAQIGSFVPASSATIGLVDRIFSRVGLMDDLASGRSTFMMEMMETANILNNATPRSLIILDEIGRGTSTYDGLSIACAVVEYLHNNPKLRAKTIFATHYHELIGMANSLPRVRNFNVAVTEEDGKVIFLRKIMPGGTDQSYGIHVAQLAGLPRPVLHRAQEVLNELKNGENKKKGKKSCAKGKQLALLPQRSPVLEELERIDINHLTPLEAINKLYELQKRAQSDSL